MRLIAAAAAAFIATLLQLSGRCGVWCGLLNAGPYDLKMTRHELCKDQGSGEAVVDMQTYKKNTHKTFMGGSAMIPFDFDDTIETEMNFSRLGSRGWGKNAYKLKDKNFCTNFRDNYPIIFEYYFKGWGIEKPSCPIKSGNYTIDLDTDVPQVKNLPMLPYGTYKVSYAMYRGSPPVRFLCHTWYATCTERPR